MAPACFIANASVTSKGTLRTFGDVCFRLSGDLCLGGRAPPFWADLAVFFPSSGYASETSVCLHFIWKKEEEKTTTRVNTEGKVQCSILCSPQSRMWAEMQPRGHRINQVACGNSTSCLETDRLISLALPSIAQSIHLSYRLFLFFLLRKLISSFPPNQCLQTSCLLLSIFIKARQTPWYMGLLPPGNNEAFVGLNSWDLNTWIQLRGQGVMVKEGVGEAGGENARRKHLWDPVQ